jgi:hypothetical protein
MEKRNGQTTAADSWERSTVCVRNASGFEGVLVVQAMVIEPVSVGWGVAWQY